MATEAEKIEDGGTAFPFAATDDSNIPLQASAMRLRDWFASQAIASLIIDVGDRSPFCEVAELAYEMADAMLKARKGEA